MRLRHILFTLLLLIGFLPAEAQTNKKIKNLQARRTELQKQITQSEKLLLTMKKDVKSQLGDLAVLDGQISQQQRYVSTIDSDIKALDEEIEVVEVQLETLEADLKDKRAKYEKSMKYAFRNNRSIQSKLMFVFSATTVGQMYRRSRYVREYASYLKAQGEQLISEQKIIQQKKADLLAAKGEKSTLLRQGQKEKEKLSAKQEQQKKLVADLQKKQVAVQGEINQKKKQSESLNAQIDRLVEEEIRKAEERRKKEEARREAERKRKAEAERKRKEEAARKEAEARRNAAANANNSNATKKNENSSSQAEKNNSPVRKEENTEVATTTTTTKKAERMEKYDASNDDRVMTGGFERNKGVMPMPITGSYVIVRHFGSHSVGGLKNVTLDSKGIDIRGEAGANARAIFDGEVSVIFSFGGTQGVLVRHGSYISVYCNLSSVSVTKGQKVKARQNIGRVANSGEDGYVLHFQLRKETAKLNPESWIRR